MTMTMTKILFLYNGMRTVLRRYIIHTCMREVKNKEKTKRTTVHGIGVYGFFYLFEYIHLTNSFRCSIHVKRIIARRAVSANGQLC